MTTSSLRQVQHRLSSRERVCSSMFIKSVWRRWRASRVSWRLALRLVMITGIFLALYILSSLNTSTSPTHNSMHVRREGVGPQARTSIKDTGWTVGGTQQLGHHDVDNVVEQQLGHHDVDNVVEQQLGHHDVDNVVEQQLGHHDVDNVVEQQLGHHDVDNVVEQQLGHHDVDNVVEQQLGHHEVDNVVEQQLGHHDVDNVVEQQLGHHDVDKVVEQQLGHYDVDKVVEQQLGHHDVDKVVEQQLGHYDVDKVVEQQLGHYDVDNIGKDHPVGQPTASPQKQQFPYRYLINEPHICDHDVNIINMIPIALTRLKRRLYIRELWGQRKYSSKIRMKTVFVVGITNSNYQSQLLHESQHYHDIIQLDFVDSYFNLTLKTLSILHWTQNFCPGAKWILKSDDDVLVNPFTLTEYLTQHPTADFVCKMNRNSQVCREGKWCPKKWQVSYEEYPFNLYPLSCHGFVYVISRKMARLVYASANKTHPYRMEDIYFTGIVAKHFNPVRQHLSKYLFPIQIKTLTILPKLGKLLFLLKPDLIKGFELTMWERILQESYNHTVTKNSGTAF
ncbi:uncharacterized protein LOC121854358 [Homarus americanus]|uniref:uncharacterized protein LOC121854358 n=1 Tax=Homarus americanus TaxID=6706 RepID=UPI001C465936|nr:uncharacterized protein LOC121854358 [Homarus americanus]